MTVISVDSSMALVLSKELLEVSVTSEELEVSAIAIYRPYQANWTHVLYYASIRTDLFDLLGWNTYSSSHLLFSKLFLNNWDRPRRTSTI